MTHQLKLVTFVECEQIKMPQPLNFIHKIRYYCVVFSSQSLAELHICCVDIWPFHFLSNVRVKDAPPFLRLKLDAVCSRYVCDEL